MRRLLLLVLVLLLSLVGAACSTTAPPGTSIPTGDWRGRIEVPGAPLDIGVTLTEDGGTFDLPAQGLHDLPLADVRRDGGTFAAALPAVPGNARFDGTLAPDGSSISGRFSQGGQRLPFRLEPGPLEPPAHLDADALTVDQGSVAVEDDQAGHGVAQYSTLNMYRRVSRSCPRTDS